MFTTLIRSRSWLGPGKQLLVVLIAGLTLAPVARAQEVAAAYDEYWPFHRAPQTVAEQAMGPQSGNALAIINNRPILYDTRQYDDDVSLLEKSFNGDILKIAAFRDPATSYRLTELLLLRALAATQSRHYQDPWDVVGCHASLAMMYYQNADYLRSESHWRRAVQLADRRDDNGRQLASLYDCLGQTLRAEGKYQAAEDAYRKALGIRVLVYGPRSPVTAGSQMNLAMLYNDWQRPEFEDQAIGKVREVMDNSVFINTTVTPGPRPVPTFMPAKTTIAGELPQMCSFAWSIINKPAKNAGLAFSPAGARRASLAVRNRSVAVR